MAKIPQAIDYGGRPSLRSNRVDTPGGGELATADALVGAANAFVAEVDRRGEKRDKFNYANAKSELLLADIEAREALKEDGDWGTYDERYRTHMKTARDRLVGTITDSDDRQLFDMESNLMVERGGVAVGEFGRKVEIDEKGANLSKQISGLQENIHLLKDRASRNDAMDNALELINSAESEGWMDSTDAQKLRESTTENMVGSFLTVMDPEEREQVLEASLAGRNNGKGSGSIADFLPADTVALMLAKTQAENKTTSDRGKAFAVERKYMALYPDPKDSAKRMAGVRRDLRGDPDALEIGVRTMRARNAEERNALIYKRREVSEEWGQFIIDGGSADEIPAQALYDMGPESAGYMEDLAVRVAESQEPYASRTIWTDTTPGSTGAPVEAPDGLIEQGNVDLTNRPQVEMPDGKTATVRSMSFEQDGVEILVPTISDDGQLLSDDEAIALYEQTGKHLGKFETPEDATNYGIDLSAAQDDFYQEEAPYSYAKWQNKSVAEKMEENLDRAEWWGATEREVHVGMKHEQEQLRAAQETAKPSAGDSIATDEQMYYQLTVGLKIFPGESEGKQSAEYNEGLWRFKSLVGEESATKYAGAAVPYQERQRILTEMVGQQALIRNSGWFNWDSDDPEYILGLNESDRARGYIPLHRFKGLMTTTAVGPVGSEVDVPITWEQFLINQSAGDPLANGRVPNEKDLENAMFAIRARMEPAEVLRRLRGKGMNPFGGRIYY